MSPLDLWIEFCDTTDCDKYLIDGYIDGINLRPVQYTMHVAEWEWSYSPDSDVYAYLYDLYNVLVF